MLRTDLTKPLIDPSYSQAPDQAGPSRRRPDPAPGGSAAQEGLRRAPGTPSPPGSPRSSAGSSAPRQSLPQAQVPTTINALPQDLLNHIANLSVDQNDIRESAARLARLGTLGTAFRAAAQSAQDLHPEVVRAAAGEKLVLAADSAMLEIVQPHPLAPPAVVKQIALVRLANVIESMPDVAVDLRRIPPPMSTEILALLGKYAELKTLSITLPPDAHDMNAVMTLLAERPGVLRSLELHGNPDGPDPAQLLRALQAQPGLEALNLSHTPLPPAVAKALAPMTRLHSLSLAGCNLGEAGAARLAETLSNHTQLRQLDLSQNQIGNACAQALAPLLRGPVPLASLVLNDNLIGPEGGQALAASLERPPGAAAEGSLRRLSLARNDLGDATAPALALALQSHPALQDLDLGRTGLSAAGTAAVIQALHHLPSLQALSLQNNTVDARGFAALSVILLERPQLQKLNLRSTAMEAIGLHTLQPALQGLTGMRHLDLSNNALNDGAAELGAALQAMQGLHTLELQSIGLTPLRTHQLAEGLQHCTELRELNLQLNNLGANNLGAAGAHELAAVLPQMPHLEKLNLGNCRLDNATMAALIPPLQAAQNLQVLRVHDNRHLDETALRAQLPRPRFQD